MNPDSKKRHVISYEKMSPELAAAFNEKYPGGYADYLQDLEKYPKPDGSFFYAVTLEIPDAIYLVKIKVKVDDHEDIERWLERTEFEETEDVAGTASVSEEDNATLPDDNIAQYGTDDDPQDA
ncbi:MAG: hypothetical protein MR414_07815 [Bacteroidales bacterium]|nr:hypothetical protein [Bacteroidales bacterium]MDD6751881.1 hypothetical protein [Bacteroidales bacterium]MDY2877811.1 hypothetical protein [Candidatus Cryptobacteroides sp.]